MGKVARKHVEGRTREERKKVRKNLGKLADLTVQQSTRKRYNNALSEFSKYLSKAGLRLPTVKTELDGVPSDYVEYLWSEGYGQALASDTLAAIQDKQPSLKGHLRSSWRLLKTWGVNEIPNRAAPLPESALHAMVGHAFFNQRPLFGLSLLVGFYGMLRTGELLDVKASHITQPRQSRPSVISLGYTKGGKRQGAAESATIGVRVVTQLLYHWIQTSNGHSSLCPPPHIWRELFNSTIEALNFQHFGFRPYSLRRGGATFWFQQHGSLDKLLVQGRWASQKTARIYINEGLALLADLKLPWCPENRIFLTQYHNLCHQPVPKLEPTCPKTRRAGGRGVKRKR